MENQTGATPSAAKSPGKEIKDLQPGDRVAVRSSRDPVLLWSAVVDGRTRTTVTVLGATYNLKGRRHGLHPFVHRGVG